MSPSLRKGRARFSNPVLPGFHPDPSVCRAGDDYYLVTSSFHYFPGVPVFHSRDLVHWRPIGHCLTRKSQLRLDRASSSGGIFAPTIRRHGDRFYMTTTNWTGGGNFYVSARNPAGEWSDPLWVDQEGIDPSFFFDDDGTAYYATAGAGGILQSTIDLATGRRTSKVRAIWSGTGGRFPEGPHLYKINGLYYLMIAEGGTEYGHMETIARATSPWGPFVPCPRNPILTHRDRARHPIQGVGHADLVRARDGSWWLVCLGVRPNDEFHHHLGRETFLAPVEWTPDGWPRVNGSGVIETSGRMPAAARPWKAEPVRDDFDGKTLAACWNFLRNPAPGSWSLSRGRLALAGNAFTLDDAKNPAFVGRRQEHFACRAAARLNFEPTRAGEEAGLAVYMDERHHYEMGIRRRDGRRTVFFRKRIGDLSAVVAERALDAGPATLNLRAGRERYEFSCAEAGGRAKPLGNALTRYLSKEVAGGFTGVYLAMYAAGGGKKSRAAAFFDWFDYEGEKG